MEDKILNIKLKKEDLDRIKMALMCHLDYYQKSVNKLEEKREDGEEIDLVDLNKSNHEIKSTLRLLTRIETAIWYNE